MYEEVEIKTNKKNLKKNAYANSTGPDHCLPSTKYFIKQMLKKNPNCKKIGWNKVFEIFMTLP